MTFYTVVSVIKTQIEAESSTIVPHGIPQSSCP